MVFRLFAEHYSRDKYGNEENDYSDEWAFMPRSVSVENVLSH
jgi:hypothetical protein